MTTRKYSKVHRSFMTNVALITLITVVLYLDLNEETTR